MEAEEKEEEVVQVEVEIMGVMVDNQDKQDKQTKIIIKALPLEVLQELFLKKNVPSVMELIQT